MNCHNGVYTSLLPVLSNFIAWLILLRSWYTIALKPQGGGGRGQKIKAVLYLYHEFSISCEFSDLRIIMMWLNMEITNSPVTFGKNEK